MKPRLSHTLAALFVALSVGASACTPQPSAGRPITIFAAASLAPVVEDLLHSPDIGAPDARLHSASSSTLARQLESGAEADLFLSAHPEWIAWLEERDLLLPGSVRDVAGNELVWVVPSDSGERTPLELDGDAPLFSSATARLAVGDPTHVPLGRYTREALGSLGLWSRLEPRLVPTLDARSTLRLVELGETEAGIVYASDAALSDRVFVRARIAHELHAPIRYQAAALRGARPAALELLESLSSPTALSKLRAFGFLPPAP